MKGALSVPAGARAPAVTQASRHQAAGLPAQGASARVGAPQGAGSGLACKCVGSMARRARPAQWMRLAAVRSASEVALKAGHVKKEDEERYEKAVHDRQDAAHPTREGVPIDSKAVDAMASRQHAMEVERQERARKRAQHQATYQTAAIMSSLAITGVAVAATILRFEHHLEDGVFPWLDFAGTMSLMAGTAVGMEYWSRFAHKVLWHDFELGWSVHKSHHEPRIGAFEANDVFAVMHAAPAFALTLWGFFDPSIQGGLCYGAGLGITLFGMAYMFVHDGLVHRRFPVGPVGDVPYMKRVALAHQLHHSEKYSGVPYGLFLGPQELERVGGKEDLDRMVLEVSLPGSKGSKGSRS
ncbi:unnamed protein product [Pedinophyceae sp. YPF-701]|nr:unnamed protein product [Pedinophyceae sp. YPF-701]